MFPSLPTIGRLATWAASACAVVAGASGLLVHEVYGDSPLSAAMRGQDLLTLAIVPVLVWASSRARRGSARASIIWLGTLSYLVYAYTGAAFGYPFGPLFLVNILTFTLSSAALWATASSTDPSWTKAQLSGHLPRKASAAFLLFIALVLVVSELGQISVALIEHSVPALIARSGGGGNFVYVLDLGVVAPLCTLAAYGLLRSQAWADLLGGCLMVKAISMGLALISMTVFSVHAGHSLELGLTLAYAAIAAGATAMTIWFLAPGPQLSRGSTRPR